MEKVGLVAGDGRLPVLFAKKAKKEGKDLVSVAITPEAKVDKLEGLVREVYQIGVGQLEKLINTLADKGIEKVVMLGSVNKEMLYQGVEMDQRFKKLIASLPDQSNDAILMGIVKEFERAGMEVVGQTEALSEFVPKPGRLTNVEPTNRVKEDMDFGFEMAKEISKLDIGQTVIVKNKAVMAVEGIEGTYKAIMRGGKLGNGEVVVAKVSKPDQDIRFDIPVVGLKTLNDLGEVEAKGLIVEAGKTLIIEPDKFVEKAEELGITVVAKNK